MSDKKYSVTLSPEAKEDMRSIAAHISYTLKNKIAARSQTQRIRKEIRSLDHFPHRYTHVDWEPWRSDGVHKMPVNNFTVYYFVQEDLMDVKILRIFYGGRDVEHIVSSEDE